MRFFPDPLKLPDSTFIILRDLIHERTGLYYENEKREILADKLTPRIIERGLDSFLDYYYLLKYDRVAQEEWKYLIDALSVQETFFWRESDPLKALVEVLLPQYWAAENDRSSTVKFLTPSPLGHYHQPIRIWSAACATGEEPLSIAMALNEAGWFERLPIEIYASDASPSAISKAREGLYRDRSFRTFSPELRAKYFNHEDKGWRIIPQIHKRIQWMNANLINQIEIEYLARANIIFCRNVFIYFSEQAIQKTAQIFYQSMSKPGYLFVGASESLLKIETAFQLQEVGGAFVYVKQ